MPSSQFTRTVTDIGSVLAIPTGYIVLYANVSKQLEANVVFLLHGVPLKIKIKPQVV